MGHGHKRSQARSWTRTGQATRNWLLSTSAITTVAGIATVTSALMLPLGPAYAACAPLTAGPDNTSCVGALDGTNSDAVGGNDTITITTDVGESAGATVSGGADDDSIDISSTAITTRVVGEFGTGVGVIAGDAGNDTITIDSAILGDDGAATVSGGAGNDSIALTAAITGTFVGDNASGTGVISGGADNDTITIQRSHVGNVGDGTVSGGDGADSIDLNDFSTLGRLVGGTGVASGDAGNDTITLDESRVGLQGAGTVSGGAGNDSIFLSGQSGIGITLTGTGQVLGDADNDTITLTGGVNVGNSGQGTVSGGEGADSISILDGTSLGGTGALSTGVVLGDAGNDTITLDRGIVGREGAGTVSGGIGNDVIIVNNTSAIGFFGTGVLLGDAGSDLITFDNSYVGRHAGGTVSGGADNDTITFSNLSAIGRITGSAGIVRGDAGADIITLNNSFVGQEGAGTVSGGLDSDTIALSNGSIIGADSTATGAVMGDEGADTITLDGGIVGDAGDGTVSGGAGGDSIALNDQVFLGATTTGSGVVSGDAGNDTILLDRNVIGNSGSGTVSGGADNDSITVINSIVVGRNATGTGQIMGDAGSDTITFDDGIVGLRGHGTVSGGDDADSISFNSVNFGNSTGSTGMATGDDGNDTITLDNGSRVGNLGDGTVSGGLGNDSIVLNNGSILAAEAGATGMVLGDAGSDTITLDRSYVASSGNATLSGGADADTIVLNNSSAIGFGIGSMGQVLGDAGADSIALDHSYVGRDGTGTVSGGAENDTITLVARSAVGRTAGGMGQVLGDSGADLITLDQSYVGQYGAGTVSGGSGNDSIALSNRSDLGHEGVGTGVVNGDSGNDTITLDNSYVGTDGAGTVSGGADNDSIALSNGAALGRDTGSTGLVLGDSGADTITIDDSDVGRDGYGAVAGGSGGDSIALSNLSRIGSSATGTGVVLGDTGNDTITLNDSDVGLSGAGTVSGGADNDSIALSNFSSVGGQAGSTGMVLGDAGADTITISNSAVGDSGAGTVSGGDDNDLIALSSSTVVGLAAGATGLVIGDAGADTITLDNSVVGFFGAGTVSGGADNDVIALSNGSYLGRLGTGTAQVLGDVGADTITINNSTVGDSGTATVSGGDDNDSIALSNGSVIGRVAGSTGQVLGDAGDDIITIDNATVGGAGAATVDGGADNDSIALRNGASVGAQGRILGGVGDDTVSLTEAIGRAAGSIIDGGADTDLLSFEIGTTESVGPGEFLNFEQLQKLGAGELTLTGDQTFSDFADIEEGTLILRGELTSATTTVFAGARLETIGGSFVGNVLNRGVFSPGGDSMIETTAITGNLVHATSGVFVVNINPVTGDRVNASGTATIQGGRVQVIAAAGTYPDVKDYIIIHAEAGRIGTFDGINTDLVFLDPSLIYDANNVILRLERSEIDPCDVAQSGNQSDVCGAIGDDNPLFPLLLTQTIAGARQAFDALSGEIHATIAGVLTDDNRYVREAILGRLMQANHTDGNGQTSALGAGGPEVASLAQNGLDSSAMALGYGGKSLGGKSLAPPPRSPITFWTAGFGAWGTYNGDGNAATANRDLGGFMSGADASIGGGWRLGLTTGASFSNVSVDKRNSSADAESYYLGAYTGGMVGAFALRGGGTWAWSEIDTSRAVIFPGFFERQKASYDADTSQVFGEFAYPTTMGGMSVEPFVGLAYVSIDTDTFLEHGGALASLRGRDSDQNVGYSTLGLRVATTSQWGSMLVTPHLSARWQHAFDDVTPEAALAFATTGTGFTVAGVPIAEDSALIDAGLDFALGENTTAGVSYSGQFGEGVHDNAVKGRFSWKF